MIKKFLVWGAVITMAFFTGAYLHSGAYWPFGQNLSGFVEARLAVRPATSKPDAALVVTWIDRLKKGGFIIYIRHAHREKWPQSTAFDIHEYAERVEDASKTSYRKAVCLSDMGAEEAKNLGWVFERSNLPVGKVFSSPHCRARQTALLAFGRYDMIENSLSLVAYSEKSGKPDPVIQFLHDVEVKPGKNVILVAHAGRLDLHQGGAISGRFQEIQETGMHILERSPDKKLRVVFSISSLNDLAIAATTSK